MSGPYISANGAHVSSVNLLVPWYGIAVCDLTVASAVPLSGSVSLVIGNATFAMAVALSPIGSELSRSFAGQTFARLVGGAGGWGQVANLAPLRAPAGGSVLLSTALADLAMAAKNPVTGTAETVNLAAGLDGPIGAFYVPAVGRSAGALLATLANPLWWVDAAGVTQVATSRPGPAIAPTAAQVEMLDAAKGWATVASEDVRSWATPGATYQSATVPGGLTVNMSRIKSGDDGILRIEVLFQ